MSGAEELARRFGRNLRRVRKRVGISQEELGFRSGLHRTEVGLLERGARIPRIDTLLKLATGMTWKWTTGVMEATEPNGSPSRV